MRMWPSTDRIPLAGAAALVGAVENRIVLDLQVRRAFHRHGAADMDRWRRRPRSWKSRCGAAGRTRGRHVLGTDTELVAQNASPRVHRLTTNAMSKADGSGDSTLSSAFGVKPFACKVAWLTAGACARRRGVPMIDSSMSSSNSRGAQRRRHRAVDDPPVAAAGELLKLHQREIGLDAGGVAIHHRPMMPVGATER